VPVVGIVLAAGRGARFAEADPAAPPKMLALIDDVPMVRRTVGSLLGAGVEFCLVVAAPSGAKAIGQALSGLPVRLVTNPDPSRGMFSSVQCALASARQADQGLLLPGDMPYVQPSTIAAVISAGRGGGRTVVPVLAGHRGHPVLCSSRLRDRIVAAPVDARLDQLLDEEDVVAVNVTDPGVRRDVDRPGATPA
jgi:molybdenum cofactor cytidylyltransferase